MIRVSILALHNGTMACIADTRHLFSVVNDCLAAAGKSAAFEVRIVGLAKELLLENGTFLIRPDVTIDECDKTDLIIIPSFSGNAIGATHLNKDYAVWIADQYKKGAEVASLCTGAFLLAFTGIAKGKQCTTHWLYANELRYFYPSINVAEDKLVTAEAGIYSSGGNNAYWNLLLYLVEKYTDRQTAIYVSKFFVIDMDRHRQLPFAIFTGLKDHSDRSILEAQEYIENNYQVKITVDQLAEKFHITRRTFERRFRKATLITVSEYIQRVKIEAARKQLELGRKSITEVMLDVGYSDTQTFRDVFKKMTDMTPYDYRNKFNK